MLSFLTYENLMFLVRGMGVSALLAVGALFFGMILGVIGAALKLSKFPPLRWIANFYVWLIRGTPMMLQILFFFLAVPVLVKQITGVRVSIDAYVVGLIALSLNSGAYQVELIRSGILGVDQGQWEASQTIGLSYLQTMRYVILPQAFKRIIPPMISEFTTLVKDSSLIYNIGAVELTASATILGAKTFNVIPPLIMAAVLYLILTTIITFLQGVIERRLSESD